MKLYHGSNVAITRIAYQSQNHLKISGKASIYPTTYRKPCKWQNLKPPYLEAAL